MRYFRQLPTVALRDSVDHLWCIADGPTYPTERILPTGTTELVINLGPDVVAITNHHGSQRFSGAVICGPYSLPFDIDAREHTAMLGVHFKPGGVGTALALSPRELVGSHVGLDTLWNGAAADLRGEICEAESVRARFAIVERALLTRSPAGRELSREVAFAVQALSLDHRQPSIESLAREVGFSHRRLIQLFTTQVGMPPKRFARLQRFRHAHDAVSSTPTPPHWPTFAIEHGYSDQSHMIREFQEFSGMTPVQQLRRTVYVAKDDHIALEP
ncbi:helix-turn-helix domain-containing protein [Mycolicibacterium neworleansense]|uniref:AraC family transcriptional regulator n=1 Tax=Mycolicibacterium neworleansense TaxID=146018 RepID=A0A0H5RM02_9MYCO|nr:AraC family transcriptional regulator [Mycolicibacterium neworleansense]MCV7360337.1 helix-turn-helix transcriptional regulator [Mycolicibacterium neworleansense]CRZ14507.1 AraC family transcriptional regulator [Mycolicibacterium neworleansense]